MLAFDASCAACRAVSAVVFNACGGRLEVVALGRQDVRDWRARALGPEPSWGPTLLAVDAGRGDAPDDGRVRAWTGASMAVPLVRRLGPRATLRVLRSLGQARAEARPERRAHAPAAAGMGRARFLRLAGGVAVAATVLVKSGTPAFAQGKDAAAADAWVTAHAGRLPDRYDDVVKLPLAHRRAVHAALPPAARSRLWVEHIDRFSSARPDMTARQRAVVEQVRATAADVRTFQRAPQRRQGEDVLTDKAVGAFGQADATQLLATLGPAEVQGLPDCECSTGSDKCSSSSCIWVENSCAYTSSGCGNFWLWSCDGFCYQ